MKTTIYSFDGTLIVWGLSFVVAMHYGADIRTVHVVQELPHSSDALTRLVDRIDSLVSHHRYREANAILENADIETLARTVAASESLHFLAIAGYGIEIPGIDPAMHIRRQEIVVVPATSDVIESPEHAEWIDKAFEFAATFNLYCFHFAWEAGRLPSLPVSLDDVRKGLEIDESLWDQLSLDSRLRMQNLAVRYHRLREELARRP